MRRLFKSCSSDLAPHNTKGMQMRTLSRMLRYVSETNIKLKVDALRKLEALARENYRQG